MEEKKKITKEEWAEFVSKNCDISYSLVVCLAIICIWEASCKTKEEAEAELHRRQFHISGAQAEMAIGYATSYEIPDWLDEMMVNISTHNKD